MIFISASVLFLPGTDGDGVTGVVVEGTTIKKIIKALKKTWTFTSKSEFVLIF